MKDNKTDSEINNNKTIKSISLSCKGAKNEEPKRR